MDDWVVDRGVVCMGLGEDAKGCAIDFCEIFSQVPFPCGGRPSELVFDDAFCEACCAQVETGCHAERMCAKFREMFCDEDVILGVGSCDAVADSFGDGGVCEVFCSSLFRREAHDGDRFVFGDGVPSHDDADAGEDWA